MAALVTRNDITSMVASLKDDKLSPELRLELAQKLKTLSSKKAQEAGLLFIAVQSAGPDAVSAATALRSFDSVQTQNGLGAALKHKEAGVRRAAAESLAAIGKSSTLKILIGADVDDKDTGPDILSAIRTVYGKQTLSFVMKGTRNKKSYPAAKCCSSPWTTGQNAVRQTF